MLPVRGALALGLAVGVAALGSIGAAVSVPTRGVVVLAPAPKFQPLALSAISFPNPLDGWVADVVRSGTTILRTVDGGRTWTSAGVPGVVQALDFVDAFHGWAVTTGPTGCLPTPDQRSCRDLILATQDGGKTWNRQLTAPRESSLANLQFVDDTHGWVIRSQYACQSCDAYVHVLITTDGGATWQPLLAFPSISIPSLSFATAQAGFAAGIVDSNDPNVYTCSSAFFATADGGETWHRGPPLSRRCGGVAIHFRTPTDGWALTSFVPDYDTDKLYHTTDGGTHWRLVRAPSLWNQTGFPEDVIFVTPEVGWVPFSPGAKAIAGGVAITSDGGRTWKRYLASYETAGVAVTGAREGWLIGYNQRCLLSNCGDDLLHTTNSGRTWRKVVPAPARSSAS